MGAGRACRMTGPSPHKHIPLVIGAYQFCQTGVIQAELRIYYNVSFSQPHNTITNEVFTEWRNQML